MYKIWFGNEKSYSTVLDAEIKLDALLRANPSLDDMFEIPSTYRLEGDVGVVSVKGSLINGSAGWMSIFGVTGYDDIAQGLIDAVSDKNVKSIMLEVDSPGGSAKGVRQLGDLITSVSQVKPMNVFADHIGSAAYWLGSAGGHITVEEMGMAGSIGALIVHTEYSKAMEQDGVTKTVVRAGANKVLANPIEPLSAQGLASLQTIVDDSRDMFVNQVALNRGVTYAIVQSTMGQGADFMGAKAVNAGLVDSVGTFEDALAYSKSLQSTFKPQKSVKV